MIQTKRLFGIILSVGLLLLVPLIAMQFSNEVNWTLGDFLVAGVLLISTGLVVDLVLRNVKKKQHRTILIITIIAVLLLIWLELAIGIFGTPLAGS